MISHPYPDVILKGFFSDSGKVPVYAKTDNSALAGFLQHYNTGPTGHCGRIVAG
jgi:hypothetical protein